MIVLAVVILSFIRGIKGWVFKILTGLLMVFNMVERIFLWLSSEADSIIFTKPSGGASPKLIDFNFFSTPSEMQRIFLIMLGLSTTFLTLFIMVKGAETIRNKKGGGSKIGLNSLRNASLSFGFIAVIPTILLILMNLVSVVTAFFTPTTSSPLTIQDIDLADTHISSKMKRIYDKDRSDRVDLLMDQIYEPNNNEKEKLIQQNYELSLLFDYKFDTTNSSAVTIVWKNPIKDSEGGSENFYNLFEYVKKTDTKPAHWIKSTNNTKVELDWIKSINFNLSGDYGDLIELKDLSFEVSEGDKGDITKNTNTILNGEKGKVTIPIQFQGKIQTDLNKFYDDYFNDMNTMVTKAGVVGNKSQKRHEIMSGIIEEFQTLGNSSSFRDSSSAFYHHSFTKYNDILKYIDSETKEVSYKLNNELMNDIWLVSEIISQSNKTISTHSIRNTDVPGWKDKYLIVPGDYNEDSAIIIQNLTQEMITNYYQLTDIQQTFEDWLKELNSLWSTKLLVKETINAASNLQTFLTNPKSNDKWTGIYDSWTKKEVVNAMINEIYLKENYNAKFGGDIKTPADVANLMNAIVFQNIPSVPNADDESEIVVGENDTSNWMVNLANMGEKLTQWSTTTTTAIIYKLASGSRSGNFRYVPRDKDINTLRMFIGFVMVVFAFNIYWGIIQKAVGRLLNIVFLFVISPIPATWSALDDGAMFKKWFNFIFKEAMLIAMLLIAFRIYDIVLGQMSIVITNGLRNFPKISLGGGFEGGKIEATANNILQYLTLGIVAIVGLQHVPKITTVFSQLFGVEATLGDISAKGASMLTGKLAKKALKTVPVGRAISAVSNVTGDVSNKVGNRMAPRVIGLNKNNTNRFLNKNDESIKNAKTSVKQAKSDVKQAKILQNQISKEHGKGSKEFNEAKSMTKSMKKDLRSTRNNANFSIGIAKTENTKKAEEATQPKGVKKLWNDTKKGK